MAGKLVQVATETVSSATATVTLTGINSDDVYMVAVNNCIPATDNVTAYMRITKSSTADTTSNYDYAYKDLKAYTTFSNNSSTNQDKLNFGNTGTGGSEGLNTIINLYNSSSEYSFGTQEDTMLTSAQQHRGQQGGFVHTVASASDGVQFFFSSGNISSGTFTLYKVV